jgi:pyridoxal phosphate enzyme (YggS family)
LSILGEVAGTDLKKKLPEIHNYKPSLEIQIVSHLQSNKVKFVVENCHLVQSIQSEKIAQIIDKIAQRINRIFPILLQVDFSNSLQPKGLNLKETLLLLEKIECLENVEVKGVMTIAPLEFELYEQKLRKFFSKTSNIFHETISPKLIDSKPILSMGMSKDFEIAIQEGSNMIRVGTAIFGPRLD